MAVRVEFVVEDSSTGGEIRLWRFAGVEVAEKSPENLVGGEEQICRRHEPPG